MDGAHCARTLSQFLSQMSQNEEVLSGTAVGLISNEQAWGWTIQHRLNR